MKNGGSLLLSAAVILGLFITQSNAAFNREVYSINGLEWKFIRQDVSGAEEVSFDDGGWLDITLPHDWNGGIDGINYDAPVVEEHYRGTGWYRANFTVDSEYEDKRVYVVFEAVSLTSDVWVNGVHMGFYSGGFTEFKYDITGAVNFGGDNVIAVRANSSNDPKHLPWMPEDGGWPGTYDYTVFGGIYRDVFIEISDNVKIVRSLNTPNISNATSADVDFKNEIKNHSDASQTVTVTNTIFDANGTEVASVSANTAINAGETVVIEQNSGTVSNPHLWSVDAPYLYRVKTSVSVGGEEVDQVNDPLGFRWFFLENSEKFVLNGEEMFLHGINRHQDCEGYGWALPKERHWRDMLLLKKAGFNFLRHAHYPPDREIMRACDSLGIMVFCELPATGGLSDDPDFKTNAMNQMEDMVLQHYNHPCVIVWSLGNETDWPSATYNPGGDLSYNFFNDLNTLSHELDPIRRTSASNLYGGSGWARSYDVFDVYAPQSWEGWYTGNSYYDYNNDNLISEYGADNYYDSHTETPSWSTSECSQEYATEVMEYYLAVGLATFNDNDEANDFPGHCQWAAFDFASWRRGSMRDPYKYQNVKGIIARDHETKKDAYYMYQSLQTDPADSPMVYIHSHSWTDRWSGPASKDVWAYSNCDEVELFNGIGENSFGVRQISGFKDGTRFEWDNISVEYNVLYAEAVLDGQVAARDTLILDNLPEPPGGSAERENLALNSLAGFSDEEVDNPAASAVDGDMSTRWAAAGYPQWLELDLGDTYDINEIEIAPYENRAYKFTLEVRVNNSDPWQTALDKSYNTLGAHTTSFTFEKINARYVRLNISGASGYDGDWVSIHEFRIFGEEPTEIAKRMMQEKSITTNVVKVLNNAGMFKSITVYNCRGQELGRVARDNMDMIRDLGSGMHFLKIRTFDNREKILKFMNTN